MSVSSLGNPHSKSNQTTKELFETRLQLNSKKKIDRISLPLTIKANKSSEKEINLSTAPKDFYFHKYFQLPKKKNVNSYKKKLFDLSNDSIAVNLSKFSNRKKEISNSLFTNTKTINYSIINDKKIKSTFIINKYLSSMRYNVNKLNNQKKEIKSKKQNIDISKLTKKIKKDVSKKKKSENNKNDNNKKGQLLPMNLNISSFKTKFMKNANKSGLIKSTLNKNTKNNKNNKKNRSRNVFCESELKNKDYFKKSLKNNMLSKNIKKRKTYYYSKDNSIINFGKNSKYKFLSNNNSKCNCQSFNTYDKLIFPTKRVSFNNNNSKTNTNKNYLKKNIKMHVNNLNVNNYFNCNIKYINNQINNKKIKKQIRSINDILISKEKTKTSKEKYNEKNLKINDNNNLKAEKNINLLKKENNNYYNNKKDEEYDSIFETEKKVKSKFDDESNEDSGLLSFDKIEDLIIYENMESITRNDNFLFYKNDREAFNHKYRKLLNKKFILSNS